MALDNATFIARFPEFVEIDTLAPASISQAIDDAKAYVSQEHWAGRYEDGVLWKAAHLLAMTPFGENARLQRDPTETTYNVVFKQMLRSLHMRVWVSGGYTGG